VSKKGGGREEEGKREGKDGKRMGISTEIPRYSHDALVRRTWLALSDSSWPSTYLHILLLNVAVRNEKYV
jgi:hypothetical protein